MDFKNVLAAAKRSQAAYLDDAKQAQDAFETLGYTFLGQFQNGSHQAVLSASNDRINLSISGTRFSQGKIGDLIDDIDLKPFDVGGGALVTFGAYDGLRDLWDWAFSLAPKDALFNVEGHSLGGWRARYTPSFLPDSKIGDLHTFESPKGANSAYWDRFSGELASLVSVANGRDIFVNWPFGDQWCHPPRNLIWLQDEGFKIIQPDQWPGGLKLADHDISLVVSRLEKIASS